MQETPTITSSIAATGARPFFASRLITCHVRRYHRHYNSSGHVWQGRFKAFPIQKDGHYLSVLRYVEGDPLRAGLATRAEEWAWSSLHALTNRRDHPFLADGPIERPDNWLNIVNQGRPQTELRVIHNCVKRGSPFGDPLWARKIAMNLGLESTLNPRGRPAGKAKK